MRPFDRNIRIRCVVEPRAAGIAVVSTVSIGINCAAGIRFGFGFDADRLFRFSPLQLG